jgi:hypothetical protein
LSESGFDWLIQALGLSAWVSSRRLISAFRPGAKSPAGVAARSIRSAEAIAHLCG